MISAIDQDVKVETINSPHGGTLKNLLSRDAGRKNTLTELSQTLPLLFLTDRQLCDLELILNGGFSPLDGFMDQETYESVVGTMRLTSGLLWPIPIYLDVSNKQVF